MLTRRPIRRKEKASPVRRLSFVEFCQKSVLLRFVKHLAVHLYHRLQCPKVSVPFKTSRVFVRDLPLFFVIWPVCADATLAKSTFSLALLDALRLDQSRYADFNYR